MHEQLESRLLLAAWFAARKLTVTGAGSNDLIELKIVGNRVAVFESGVQTSSFTRVRSILVEGGGGKDRITIDDSVLLATKLVGGAGNDTITGGGGPDAIYGGIGQDVLDGGLGNDTLVGQAGNDTVTYAGRTNSITARITKYYYEPVFGTGGETGEADQYLEIELFVGGSGNDQISGGDFPFERYSGEAIIGGTYYSADISSVVLRGGPGDDTFRYEGWLNFYDAYGDAGNDTFSFYGDDDALYAPIYGGDGIDTQVVENQPSFGDGYFTYQSDEVENAVVYDGYGEFHGNDLDNTIIVYDIEPMAIYAGGGNDHVILQGSYDPNNPQTVYGGEGNDRIEGGHYGSVKLYGEEGNDVLFGGQYNDTLEGGVGDDALFGYAGDDSLDGGADNDYIEGNQGIDTILGNTGNDSFYTKDHALDLIYGGAGTDTLRGDASESVIDSIETILP